MRRNVPSMDPKEAIRFEKRWRDEHPNGMPFGQEIAGEITSQVLRGNRTGKFERCVRAVTRKGGAYDPKAVCASKDRRQNPRHASDRAFEGFHGRPPSETVEVITEVHDHGHVWALGRLTKVVIRYEEKGREFDVLLKGFGTCYLTANEKRTQLFVDDGDQAIDLKAFHIPKPYHELETVGRMVMVAYFTKKDHLGDEGGTAEFVHCIENTNYYTDLGFPALKKDQEGVGPDVIYDTRNELVSFSGGSYEIPDEGIEY